MYNNKSCKRGSVVMDSKNSPAESIKENTSSKISCMQIPSKLNQKCSKFNKMHATVIGLG